MACTISMLSLSDCPPPNDHIRRINDKLYELNWPIELMYGHQNKDAIFSTVGSHPKAFFLSDEVWIEQWEIHHKNMMSLLSLFGGEHCIIKTDLAIIYADKDTYFYLGTNILYRITEEYRLSAGLNVVFRGGLY